MAQLVLAPAAALQASVIGIKSLLSGMPDRGAYVADITYHFFGDNDYVAVTGWPNMLQTHT